MKKKITCLCENSFEIDINEEFDLDKETEILNKILDGTFLNFACPSCGKNLKPEFPIMLLWPSKKLQYEVLPELDRGEFYRRKKNENEKKGVETLIGYPEMAERLTIIQDGYETIPVEDIKYHLQLKAEEQYPESDMEVSYFSTTPDSLEFHISGIKENEVAVMKVPVSIYERTLKEFKSRPKAEVFTILKHRNYISYKNTMRLETLK